jgi:hypothetical protein
MSEDDDVPTLVFEGPYAEVLFVQTLIESAGIATSSTDQMRGGSVGFYPRLFVRRADAEQAGEIVDDFRKNGHRTAY